uniref:Uncharacterized protein n=1 Tax=Glossina austeni TaxID=7395 RepID=A0A1A9VXW3_GLOAU
MRKRIIVLNLLISKGKQRHVYVDSVDSVRRTHTILFRIATATLATAAAAAAAAAAVVVAVAAALFKFIKKLKCLVSINLHFDRKCSLCWLFGYNYIRQVKEGLWSIH